MRALVAGIIVVIAGCSSGRMPPADRWHTLAAEGHRMTSTVEGMAWERRMLPVHNGFWADVIRTCAAEPMEAGIESFQAVAVIDGSGIVKEYLINPSAPHLACFSREMVGRQYPAPPSAPFYEVYTISLVRRD
ncbi:hypothetical protein LF41_2923 [Lysobacter dokdonensis DS-58]|uniref:TonB C-terminal domain-containing protein n=2 Tax=Noviluteimonas TaxID=3382693 RepID=A0A0A2WKN4_9GAMM|nr:hypothetical protein LF41_2923 [Lysobacter dokdonensis DS-58]